MPLPHRRPPLDTDPDDISTAAVDDCGTQILVFFSPNCKLLVSYSEVVNLLIQRGLDNPSLDPATSAILGLILLKGTNDRDLRVQGFAGQGSIGSTTTSTGFKMDFTLFFR